MHACLHLQQSTLQDLLPFHFLHPRMITLCPCCSGYCHRSNASLLTNAFPLEVPPTERPPFHPLSPINAASYFSSTMSTVSFSTTVTQFHHHACASSSLQFDNLCTHSPASFSMTFKFFSHTRKSNLNTAPSLDLFPMISVRNDLRPPCPV